MRLQLWVISCNGKHYRCDVDTYMQAKKLEQEDKALFIDFMQVAARNGFATECTEEGKTGDCN